MSSRAERSQNRSSEAKHDGSTGSTGDPKGVDSSWVQSRNMVLSRSIQAKEARCRLSLSILYSSFWSWVSVRQGLQPAQEISNSAQSGKLLSMGLQIIRDILNEISNAAG